MRINLGFWFLFFGLLVCQFSCVNDAENRLDDPVAREGFFVLLEEKPFGPYVFTNQPKVSFFASLIDLLNQELSNQGVKYGISGIHRFPDEYSSTNLCTIYLPAMPIARLFESLARQLECTCTNRICPGFYEFDGRKKPSELPSGKEGRSKALCNKG